MEGQLSRERGGSAVATVSLGKMPESYFANTASCSKSRRFHLAMAEHKFHQRRGVEADSITDTGRQCS